MEQEIGLQHPWQKVKLAVVSHVVGIGALPEPELLARLEALCIEGVRIGVTVQRDGAPAREFADPDSDWPIARVQFDADGNAVALTSYTPGLPEGVHDVWCTPVQHVVAKVARPVKARAAVTQAIERLRYVDREILEDIESALQSGVEDHASPDLDELDCTLLLDLLWLWRHARPALVNAPVVQGMAETATRLDGSILALREGHEGLPGLGLGDLIALRGLLSALDAA